MPLLKYFKLKSDSLLPNPNGHLSKLIPSYSIIAANEAVKHAASQTTKTRGILQVHSVIASHVC